MQGLDIAIVGNKDQTSLMRMAGISKYRHIVEGEDLPENIRKSVNEFLDDAAIGIILIPEDWTHYISDIIEKVRKDKRISTVIVEIPPDFSAERLDVKAYYKAYTKKLIGFNVEI
jgi:vacuolar-type H+-ATPase subunit F/Vma7